MTAVGGKTDPRFAAWQGLQMSEGDILESLHDAVICTDLNWVVQHWNRAAADLYGWSSEEAIGTPVAELVRAGWRDGEREEAMEALLREGLWLGEVVQHHRDGSELHVQATISALRNSTGETIGAVSINRDVTQLRRLECKLRREQRQWYAVEDLLRTVRDVGAAIVRETDRDRLLDAVCERLAKHPGIAGAILLDQGLDRAGQPFVRVHSAGHHALGQELRQQLERGELQHCCGHDASLPVDQHGSEGPRCPTCQLLAAGVHGPARCFQVSHASGQRGLLALFGDTGAPLEQEQTLICGMVDDLALALHALQQGAAKRDAERQREQLLNLSQDLICVATVEGRFEYINPACERILGYTPAEMAGRPFFEFVHVDDHTRVQSEVTSLVEGKPTLGFECRFLAKSGDQRVLSWAASPLPDEGLVFAIGRDVTSQKTMETELAHVRKLEAVGQLAAGIAHEINTPAQFVGDNVRFVQVAVGRLLTLIQHYQGALAQLKAQDNQLSRELARAERKAKLDYISEEVPASLLACSDGLTRIASIVGAMKEFAHPGQVEQLPADINEALATTLTIARNEYKYVAEVETELGELPPVVCNISDLNQAFLNLVVNAAHAISDVVGDSGDKGTIRIRTQHAGPDVWIEVEDTGPGMSKTVQERIFDPFFTTKEVGKGSGQGLPITRAVVVEKHGGHLTYSTEEGRGTTFTIRIPVGGLG
ncbi:MAG: PAS domain S-box protein, partial [Myxococcales bacterium]|nr:PAS domain S-box protein [Myxococcales bacterium]